MSRDRRPSPVPSYPSLPRAVELCTPYDARSPLPMLLSATAPDDDAPPQCGVVRLLRKRPRDADFVVVLVDGGVRCLGLAMAARRLKCAAGAAFYVADGNRWRPLADFGARAADGDATALIAQSSPHAEDHCLLSPAVEVPAETKADQALSRLLHLMGNDDRREACDNAGWRCVAVRLFRTLCDDDECDDVPLDPYEFNEPRRRNLLVARIGDLIARDGDRAIRIGRVRAGYHGVTTISASSAVAVPDAVHLLLAAAGAEKEHANDAMHVRLSLPVGACHTRAHVASALARWIADYDGGDARTTPRVVDLFAPSGDLPWWRSVLTVHLCRHGYYVRMLLGAVQ